MTSTVREATPPAAAPAATAASLFVTEAGRARPLGAIPDAGGVNFSVFSEHATAVELLLFNEHDDPEPIQIIKLDPIRNRTFHFWHVYIRDLKPGSHYAYRVDGPRDLHGDGHRFNPNKVLIDPYARGNTTALWDRGAACGPDDNLYKSMRSVVIDLDAYDWEGDEPINRPIEDAIIYEAHVGGFTKSPTSGVTGPGTFAAIVQKIPYLKALGINAIELLPVAHFDADEDARNSPVDGRRLTNYWGYSTVSFFAPDKDYCCTPEEGSHITEFRDMVKELHKAGIEVILDVVFNHTSEGQHQGPVFNFKGFDNSIYYHLVPSDKQYFMDYTGCGNTVNCNHPIPEKFITDCLEYWVKELHVDGFRFDEGSVLSRGEDGAPMEHPPVLWNIELSEILANTKVMAEAWDAGGLYQIGRFPGYRWAEWNGKFRDDIRRFVRGDTGLIPAVASRIAGSADLYQASGHAPINSVNFVACHDGFTLNDLVSYNHKHNEANGEHNRDGLDENLSWNCGVEGDTDNSRVDALRRRQIKNFTAILMLSRGVPMFVAGDEVRRSQQGNNNGYCQDNELNWLDWSLLDKNRDIFDFFSQMIAFRKAHPALRLPEFYTGQSSARGLNDIAWHGCKLNSPGWEDQNSNVLAFTIAGLDGDNDIHVMMNMCGTDLDFEVPPVERRNWYRVVDTAAPAPQDFTEPDLTSPISQKRGAANEGTYHVTNHSIVVLVSKEA